MPSDPMADERMTALAGEGVRALLIGTGGHGDNASLPDVPAAAATVKALGAALVARCGLWPDNLHVLVDPADPIEFGDALTTAADAAEDVLLVYYVGHGLVSRDGSLHLATAATDGPLDAVSYKAFSCNTVRETLLNCRARSIILVLDCCSSGRAPALSGPGVADAFDLPNLDGGFLLAAAAADEAALAPPDAPYTTFTGLLLDFVEAGDPSAPPTLTWEHAYEYVLRTCTEHNLPRPVRQADGRAGKLPLTGNRAYRQPVRESRPVIPVHHTGAEAECPYRGLNSFTVEDARYFFGRESTTAELLRKAAGRSHGGGPLLVIGPSGAGKSSLLHAGFLASVRRGELGILGSASWPRRSCTPGERPLQRLAELLRDLSGETEAELSRALLESPSEAVTATRNALAGLGRKLVLVVDQIEELFTACQDEHDRWAFITALCALSEPVDEGDPCAVVVLGLRADFYGHFMQYPELVRALGVKQVLVRPMAAAELREAIERPAEAAGLALEDGLVEMLLSDLWAGRGYTHDTTTALPLLSYVLQVTWQRRQGRVLTLRDYQETGRVWEAVAQRADQIFTELVAEFGKPGENAARVLLLRLVRIGDGLDHTRRQVDLPLLLDGMPEPRAAAIRAAVTAFAHPDARLITLDQDSAQITHEALIHAWPRLRGWIAEDHSALLLQQKFTEDTESWHRSEHDPALLWRGERLVAMQQWATHDPTRLNEGERRFLRTSLRSAKRRTTLLWSGTATLALLLVIAVTVALLAFDQARVATSNTLVAEAEASQDADPRKALMLGAKALAVDDTPRARRTIADTITNGAHHGILPVAATALAFSPEAGIIAAADPEDIVTLWDGKEPGIPRRIGARAEPESHVAAMTFSADGSGIHILDDNGDLSRWNATAEEGPRQRTELPAGGAGSDDRLVGGFGLDGAILATAQGRTVTTWRFDDTGPPRATQELPPHTSTVTSVAYSPDGEWLAVGGSNGMVRVWDVGRPDRTEPISEIVMNSGAAGALAFTGDRALAVGYDDRTTVGWDLTTPEKPRQTRTFRGNTGVIEAMAADARQDADHRRAGPTLVTSSPTGGSAVLWDSWPSWWPPTEETGALDPVLAFTPDLRTVTTLDRSEQLRYQDITDPAHPQLRDSPPAVASMPYEFTSRDHRIVTTPDETWLDFRDPEKPMRLESPPGQVLPLAMSADGRILAADMDAWSVRTWRADEGPESSRQVSIPLEEVLFGSVSVALGPDGQLLALTGDDGNITLRDLSDPANPALISTPSERAGSVMAVAFSPDGNTLAVGSNGGNVVLWDISIPARPRPLADALLDHKQYIGHLAFSADGHRLAVTSFSWNDRYVALHDIAELLDVTEHPRDAACEIIGTPLNEDEWSAKTDLPGSGFLTAPSGSDVCPPPSHE